MKFSRFVTIIAVFYGGLGQLLAQTATPTQKWKTVEMAGEINLRAPTIKVSDAKKLYMVTNADDLPFFGGVTLIRYDSLGEAIWNKQEVPNSVPFAPCAYGSFAVENNNDCYVSINHAPLPDFNSQVDLFKFSAIDGTEIWKKSFLEAPVGNSFLYQSEFAPNGDLIVVGENVNNNDTLHNFTFITAIDPATGTTKWSTRFEGYYYVSSMALFNDSIRLVTGTFPYFSPYYFSLITLDYAGNIVSRYDKPLIGALSNSIAAATGEVFLSKNRLNYDYSLTKLNAVGDTLWRYEYPNPTEDKNFWVTAMVADSVGDVYMTGLVKLSDGKTVCATTKVASSDGQVLWQALGLSIDNLGDAGEFLAEGEDYIAVAGATQFPNTDVVGFIAVYDKVTGAEEFVITLPYDNIFEVIGLSTLGNEIYFVGTGFMTNLDSITAVMGCFVLPMVSSITGPSDTEWSNTWSVYPNPTVYGIQVSQIDRRQVEYYQLLNPAGSIVMEGVVNATELYLNVEQLPAGQYTLVLSGKQLRVAKNIIKF